jgi:hypothetical protein
MQLHKPQLFQTNREQRYPRYFSLPPFLLPTPALLATFEVAGVIDTVLAATGGFVRAL